MTEPEQTRTEVAAPPEYTDSGFRGRTVVLAVIVCAITAWLSPASETKLLVVLAVSAVIVVGFSIMQATFIEYGVMLGIWIAIAIGLRYNGHPEFLWPCLSAGIIGALNGMGGRESRMAWMRHLRTGKTEQEPTGC